MPRPRLVATFAILSVVAALALTGCASSAPSDSAAGASSSQSNANSAPKAQSDWYAKTYGTFAPISQSGSSDAVFKLPAGVKAGIITASYTGSGNFSIAGLDSSNGPTTDLPVNTIGAYKGVSVFGVNSIGNSIASLKVTADASWTINIAPMDTATSLESAGTGNGVYKYDGKSATWAITGTGNGGNFSVIQYSSNIMPNLAVNEIGNYTGSVPAQAGPSVVVITSDGTWTIK